MRVFIKVNCSRRERRVTVTQDTDLLRSAIDLAHFGIAYYPHGKRAFGEIIRHLTLMHDAMAEDDMLGCVEYL